MLHMRVNQRRRGMTVPRNSLARCNARHLRIRHLVQFILVGAVYHNALSNCAALLCRTQRRVARLCSRIMVSDAANTRIHERTQCVSAEVKILCRTPFAAVTALRFSPDYLTRERQEFKEEGHSFNPRTAREKGLAAYGQTVGVPSSLSPPRTRQSPALRRAQLPAR